MEKITKTNEDWKKELDPEVYKVTREAGTERPFTGKYWDEHKKGMYKCSNCGLELFSSDTKFDSGTGWPSFDNPINKEHVVLKEDTTLGVPRTEVLCARCGAHLGNVFNDGPKATTGLRFCMNSCSLDLEEDKN